MLITRRRGDSSGDLLHECICVVLDAYGVAEAAVHVACLSWEVGDARNPCGPNNVFYTFVFVVTVLFLRTSGDSVLAYVCATYLDVSRQVNKHYIRMSRSQCVEAAVNADHKRLKTAGEGEHPSDGKAYVQVRG